MKLELKKIKVNLQFSEETTMFQAELYVNGKSIAYCKNDGRGGCTDYRPHNKDCFEPLKQAEEYAKSLPKISYGTFEIDSNLEHWIDREIENYLKRKEEKKMDKLMETNIVFGKPNGMTYSYVGFKGKPKLSELKKTQKGLEALNKLISNVKSKLKTDEVILNKNI